MHLNDCKHSTTHTSRAVLAVRVRGRCLVSGQGEVKWSASMCYVYSDRLHGVHIYACVFARDTELFFVCVCLCIICAYPPVYQVCPLSRQIQPDSRLGQGKRCASERRYHCSVCKTKLTIGREGERE